VADTFFTVTVDGDDEWFVPTDHTRGPWDPASCHAGPPAGLLARAFERLVPTMRLARVTLDLTRPIPMAGFRIESEVVRAGRSVATARATIVDADGAARVTASGLYVATASDPVLDRTLGIVDTPALADAEPGDFPIAPAVDERPPGFNGAGIAVRYPPGDGPTPGPTTMWMRTVDLLPHEPMSPFQRVCPLADCGNALSRHTEPWDVAFVNVDLTIVLHRDPVGEWIGTRVASHWQPTGVGLADATLFDDAGPVGTALQAMLLRLAAR